MYGVNNFAGKCRGNIHFVIVSKGGSNAIAKEKVVPSEKVSPSEGVEKGNNIFNGM